MSTKMRRRGDLLKPKCIADVSFSPSSRLSMAFRLCLSSPAHFTSTTGCFEQPSRRLMLAQPPAATPMQVYWSNHLDCLPSRDHLTAPAATLSHPHTATPPIARFQNAAGSSFGAAGQPWELTREHRTLQLAYAYRDRSLIGCVEDFW